MHTAPGTVEAKVKDAEKRLLQRKGGGEEGGGGKRKGAVQRTFQTARRDEEMVGRGRWGWEWGWWVDGTGWEEVEGSYKG